MMEQRFYRFAGLDFMIEMDSSCFDQDERNLSQFRTGRIEDAHRFTYSIVEKIPDPQGEILAQQPNFTIYEIPDGHIRYVGGAEPYLRAIHSGKKHSIQVRKNPYSNTIGTKVILESLEVEHMVATQLGFVFHCSYIDHNGRAILFTAPSETGKSTQAELWKQHRNAEIINGDRAAIRMADGKLNAEGIPFSGSSQYCKNRSLPIDAIVYLGQAPVTTIRRLRGYEAFSRIWEGISVNTWDRKDLESVSDLVKRVVETVPVYHMPCTPDESAVIALERELRKQAEL